MADGEDRPIIVSGGDQMVTVTLPLSAKPHEGPHTMKPLPANGTFKTVVFTDTVTNKVEFSRPATGRWKISIE